MKLNLKNVMAMACMGLSVMACSDNDGGKEETPDTKKFTDLNVSAYDQWTYVNLRTGETETHPDASEWIYTDGTTRPAQTPEEVSIDWHIAVHRYEVKTNGGSVLDTKSTDMAAFNSLPEGDYKADEVIDSEDEYKITTDMSGMMQSNIGYAKSATINRVLCGWMTKTYTGSMPPYVYTPTKNVIVLKCKDGSWAKIQCTTAGNTTDGKSGYVSFNYQFYEGK